MARQLTYKEYLMVTIPFMLSTVTQPLLGVVNTAIMGHMSEVFYIAAVSLGVILFNNIYWLFGFLRVSTTSFSAQALGKNSDESKFLSLFRPLVIAFIISVVFICIYPFIFAHYVEIMQPEASVISLMKKYCDIVIWGAPFVLFNYVTLGWLMGQMIIRYTMFMQISMNVVNIILSFVFVFILHMDIEGVAYSSLIAQVYGCIIGFMAIYFKGNLNFSGHYVEQLKSIKPFLSMMKVNTDLMLRTICLLTINNLFAMAGTSLGTTTLAANAVSVFAGKAFGKKDKQLLNETLQIGLRCLAVFMVVSSIVVYLMKSYLIGLMTNLPEISMYADEYSIFLVIHPIFGCVGLLLYGIYTGVGQTSSVRNMMFIAVIFFYLCQNILVEYFANYGIWVTYSLTYLLESIILILFLPQIKLKFE